MTQREPEEVSFAARTVRPPRRRIDPLFVGIGAVVVVIGLLVVKPWQGPSTTERPASSAGVVVRPVPSGLEASPAASPAAVASLDWATAARDVLARHDTWGVRAIVQTADQPAAGTSTGLAERWTPIVGDGAIAGLPSDERAVLALGVTFPPDDAPVDVRILQAVDDGSWRWIDVPLIPGTPAIGGFLFAPPIVGGVQLEAWPAGAYALDVLWRGVIHRVEVPLVGRFGRSPLAPPETAPDPPLKSAATDLGSLQPGPFVVSDGIALHLPALGLRERLDPANGWLAADGGEESPGSMARLYTPRANGLGFLAPVGATDLKVSIQRVFPNGPSLDVQTIQGTEITGLDIQAPYAIFTSPAGRPFRAGQYALDASWTDRDGAEQRVFHVELEPGLHPPTAPLLLAERATRGDAGRAVLIGSDGVHRIELSVEPKGDLFDERGCAALPPGVDTSQTSIIVLEPTVAVDDLTATLDFVPGTGDRVSVPLLRAVDPTRGALLLAANVDGGLASGVYRLTVHDGKTARLGMLCIGPRVSY